MSTTRDDDAPPRAEPRRGGVPIAAFVIGAIVALCGGGIVVALALKDTVVTSRAREALVERGVVCDERFALSVDWGFSEVTIAPTRCQLTEVTFADSIELTEGGTATLAGLSVTSLRAPSVIVHRAGRATATVDLGPLGALGTIAGIGDGVGAAARASSELARHRPVPTNVDRLEMRLDGATVMTLERIAVTGEGPIDVAIDHADFDEIAGPLGTRVGAELSTITGTADAATCHLEADLSATATIPILGGVSHRMHVTLDGAALDAEAPTFRVGTR